MEGEALMEKLETTITYRKIRLLGKGGMGEVFEAEAPDGRRVALKVFHAEKSRRFLEERFRAEARLLKTLYHPRIVRVHDFGVDESDGRAWYAMDLVLGEDGTAQTLEDVRRRRSADDAQMRQWFAEVKEALCYLHVCGVVHRDVKLENILIDENGHARLADFGVSRIIDVRLKDEVGSNTTFVTGETTGTRPVMGTYFYIPPAVRAGAEAGPEADFYALGVAFFRLLTGIWYEQGTNAIDLLAPFGEFWRKTLPGLLSCEGSDERQAEMEQKGVRRGGWRRAAWLALAVAASMAAVCVAALCLRGRAPSGSLPRPRTANPQPGVLVMESVEDLRGVDIGAVTSLVVGAAMGSIPANMFNGWPSLRKVEVGEGVEAVHSAAFFKCGRLESVVLPNSLKKIGAYAFGDCFSLRSVRCGSGLLDVGHAAFGGCTNLVDVYFAGDAPAALGMRIYVRTPTNLVNHVDSRANGWGGMWPPGDASARVVRRGEP